MEHVEHGTNRGSRQRPPSVRSAKAGYAAANKMAADIVLSEVARYGGEQAGLVQWARAVVEQAQPTITGPLFQKTAA